MYQRNPFLASPDMLLFSHQVADKFLELSQHPEKLSRLVREDVPEHRYRDYELFGRFVNIGKKDEKRWITVYVTTAPSGPFETLASARPSEIFIHIPPEAIASGSIFKIGVELFGSSPGIVRLQIAMTILHELIHAIDPQVDGYVRRTAKYRKKMQANRKLLEHAKLNKATEEELARLHKLVFSEYIMSPWEIEAHMAESIYHILSYIDQYQTVEERVKAKRRLRSVIHDHLRSLSNLKSDQTILLMHAAANDIFKWRFWREQGGIKFLRRYLKAFYQALDLYPDEPPAWLQDELGLKYRQAIGERLYHLPSLDKPKLGVGFMIGKQGIVIKQLVPNGLAERSGFRIDDEMLSANGDLIKRPSDYNEAVKKYDRITFVVSRKDELLEIQVDYLGS